MGKTIVKQVIEALTAAEIRADEAYPGARIPTLSGSVAAVRLGKMDRSIRTTAVEIIIMTPAAAGGSQCEKMALRAVQTMQDMGASCTKQVCRFDEMADVFYIEIEAEFFGTALESSWSAGPGYAVSIGIQPLEQVVSFQSKHAIDAEHPTLSAAPWEFMIEELLLPGTSEPSDPAEPFTLTVSRDSGEEVFSGCTWSSVRREDTIRGISQIRAGTATARTNMSIL